MLLQHAEDAEEHFKVVKSAGVRGRIVGHEEPEQEKDCVLKCESDPVDCAPGGILGHDARQETSYQYTEQIASCDDR